MTWHANQVYTSPTTDVIDAFRSEPFLSDQLYHVDSLNGVRDEWSREMLLAEHPPGDRKHMRHGLPLNGLLVVSPEIYETGYDRQGPSVGEFSRHYCHNTPWPHSPPSRKWASIFTPPQITAFLPDCFGNGYYSRTLLCFLKSVYNRTSVPLQYYHCFMWGGDIEEETAWVIDAEERVYQHADDDSVIEHTPQGRRLLQGDLLRTAMRHVGVDLPTRFFALHQASFHWRVYRLEEAV